MGLIECRSGRLDSGIALLRQALGAEPENTGFRVILARALVDAGRPNEALDVATKPSGTTPAELALWHARAEAADLVPAWEESVVAWRLLSAVRPDHWAGWSNLARAASALARWDEAADALKRAAELNPKELPLRRALATALSRAGRFNESADELERWVEATPDDVATRIILARLFADLGRERDMRLQLEKVATIAGLDRFEESPDALLAIARKRSGSGIDLEVACELAHLLDRANRPEALDSFLDVIETSGIDRSELGYSAAAAALRQGKAQEARAILLRRPLEPDPIRWHWMMSRSADALGDFDAAFAEAEAMNRSEHNFESWRQRGEDHLNFIRKLGDAITPKWAEDLKPLNSRGRSPPAFLVGFPRSGTTLLDTFLLGHSDTLVLEEKPLIAAVEAALGGMLELPQRSQAELEEAREAYFTALDQHVDPAFAGLIVDKLPLNMLAAPYLHAIFPDAKFIFAQRHPCDAVLSCFMQSFAPNKSMASFLDLGTAAEYYDAAFRLWTRSREVLPLNVHTLVYEELVSDPEQSLRPLINFLGLEWRDELLDHRSAAKARGPINTPSYNQVTQPLSRAPSGRWKRYKKHLEPVLPILLPWAERLGYAD